MVNWGGAQDTAVNVRKRISEKLHELCHFYIIELIIVNTPNLVHGIQNVPFTKIGVTNPRNKEENAPASLNVPCTCNLLIYSHVSVFVDCCTSSHVSNSV